jgi:hypothetical protein
MRVKTCRLGGGTLGEPARHLLRERGPGRVSARSHRWGFQLTSAFIMNVDAQGNLTGTIETRNRTPVTTAASPGRKIATLELQ